MSDRFRFLFRRSSSTRRSRRAAITIESLEPKELLTAESITEIATYITERQYTDASKESFGAIRDSEGPGFYQLNDPSTATDDIAAFKVEPYFAAFAVHQMLVAGRVEAVTIAENFIDWYVKNLNSDGTMDVHWYDQNGDRVFDVRANPEPDSHDSYAAMFLAVVDEYEQLANNEDATSFVQARESKIRLVADQLRSLRKDNALTHAKNNFPVMYLADNVETWLGFQSMARIETDIFGNAEEGMQFTQDAEDVKTDIMDLMYDDVTGYFHISLQRVPEDTPPPANHVALEKDGIHYVANRVDFDEWYNVGNGRISMLIVWPALFGMIDPDSSMAVKQVSDLRNSWNGQGGKFLWSNRSDSAAVTVTNFLAGDRAGTVEHLTTLLDGPFPGTARYPGNLDGTEAAAFTIADAGMLLRLAALDSTLFDDAAANSADQIGVRRQGDWFLDADGNGVFSNPEDLQRTFGTGTGDEITITGDWNRNARDEIGTFENGLWRLDLNGNGIWEGDGLWLDREIEFGVTGDTPIVGDWNGDGRDKIGVHRTRNNESRFYLDVNGNGKWDGNGIGLDRYIRFGVAGDTPLSGDWDGNGVDEIGVNRIRNNESRFYLDVNNNGTWDGNMPGFDRYIRFGVAGDTALVGDWNGDGIDEIGVHRFRNNESRFYLDADNSGSWTGTGDGNDIFIRFGVNNDIPVVGNWV